jgi:hypothetical protein
VRTPYGFQYASIRHVDDARDYVRLYTFVLPFHQIRSLQVERRQGSGQRQQTPTNAGHMWVPIDDDNTLVFNWLYAVDEDKPLTPEFIERSEANLGRGPNGESRLRHRTRENDWLIDREMQRTRTFTGVAGVNTQDLAMQESMGRIVDRSREHLGTTDRAIIAFRQILLDAVDAVARGEDPPGVDPRAYRNVRASDLILPRGSRWQDVAERELAARR